MKRGKVIAPIAAAIGFMLIAFPSSSATAQQPPQPNCVAVPKIQYDSAKKQYLLRNASGMYVRTGRLFRRHYWYCH
jgi:hypothetical protein